MSDCNGYGVSNGQQELRLREGISVKHDYINFIFKLKTKFLFDVLAILYILCFG